MILCCVVRQSVVILLVVFSNISLVSIILLPNVSFVRRRFVDILCYCYEQQQLTVSCFRRHSSHKSFNYFVHWMILRTGCTNATSKLTLWVKTAEWTSDDDATTSQLSWLAALTLPSCWHNRPEIICPVVQGGSKKAGRALCVFIIV